LGGRDGGRINKKDGMVGQKRKYKGKERKKERKNE
jgi:hypothetical protein